MKIKIDILSIHNRDKCLNIESEMDLILQHAITHWAFGSDSIKLIQIEIRFGSFVKERLYWFHKKKEILSLLTKNNIKFKVR